MRHSSAEFISLSHDWLAQRALRSPDQLALVYGERARVFRRLDAEVTQLARSLLEHGVQPETRVAVLMRNSDDYALVVHALSRLGAILVPLNTRLTAREIAWQLGHINASILLHDETNQPRAVETLETLPNLQLESVSNLHSEIVNQQSAFTRRQSPFENQKLVPSAVEGSKIQTHSILFTSGTTGNPKAALLTYHNHWSNAVASALNLGLDTDDVWLVCMPLYHIGGLAILLRGVIYGNPVIIHPAFDPDAVNRAFDEQRVSIVSLVSTMLQRVLDARGDKPFPPTLRCVLLGGGPATAELLERCARVGVPVVQTYGLTEAASQVATLTPRDALRKLGSAGKPLMGIELRIEQQGEPLPQGEIGEIVISGPTVMREYVNDPQATARALRDGWFYTGDMGYLDDEGFLYVVSRRDDLIVSGGENIYPAEIEAVLNTHPSVIESAVIGVSHPEWGQSPAAYVVLQNGDTLTQDELQTFCARQLARFKIPTNIYFIPELPRNASGKVLRRNLAPPSPVKK